MSIVSGVKTYLSNDLFQFGVRTEGIQEAIMKAPEVPANADRITKMKQVMKAVSDHHSSTITNQCVSKTKMFPTFSVADSFPNGGPILPASPWPLCT